MPKLPRSSHLHRGASFHRRGDARVAAREYQQHLAANPEDKVGHYHLALALQQSGNTEAAACCYARALEIDPYYPEALNNLGILLHLQGKLDAAKLCFARALVARPSYNDAEYNYATVESDTGNCEAALLHFSRVLERDPKRVDAWNNLAKLFLDLRQPAEARRACQIALNLNPAFPDACWNRSLADLTLGQLPQGWNGFEFRGTNRHKSLPQWAGESLIGKRILLHAEQGIGDAIQFVRYCSHVKGDYILQAHSELADLLNCISFEAELPPVDVQVPLMSLPGLFGTTLDTIPAQVPYLHADALLAAEWNTRLVTPGHSLRVGLVWAGNPHHRNDRNRSLDPSLLAPLAAVENVSFFCLQQEPQSAAAYSHPIPFTGIFDRVTWADTAAILMNLDLLISVDTAVIHLAGALGRPVWTLLPYAADWRWMLERTDSPWYPTMRLFRQTRPRDWACVIAAVANDLRSFASGR